jgi:hypothetical protein
VRHDAKVVTLPCHNHPHGAKTNAIPAKIKPYPYFTLFFKDSSAIFACKAQSGFPYASYCAMGKTREESGLHTKFGGAKDARLKPNRVQNPTARKLLLPDQRARNGVCALLIPLEKTEIRKLQTAIVSVLLLATTRHDTHQTQARKQHRIGLGFRHWREIRLGLICAWGLAARMKPLRRRITWGATA